MPIHPRLTILRWVVLALMPLAVLLFAAAAKLMEGKSLMLLAVVTVGLSICNVLVRTRYWGRSNKVLSAIRSRNGITDDFWLEHRLRVDEQGFRLICGEQDHAGSCVRYNKGWHKQTGTRLEWIKDAGHNSNTDQPQLVNQLIEDFVKNLPSY